MIETRIGPRERMVLTAIIEQYIATGEPVASQAVAHSFAHREGLSSATIRNAAPSRPAAASASIPARSARRRFAPLARSESASGRAS